MIVCVCRMHVLCVLVRSQAIKSTSKSKVVYIFSCVSFMCVLIIGYWSYAIYVPVEMQAFQVDITSMPSPLSTWRLCHCRSRVPNAEDEKERKKTKTNYNIEMTTTNVCSMDAGRTRTQSIKVYDLYG